MRKTASGFTIVELLIVIVVIAVLASITVVAFRGVQSRSRDAVRYTDVKLIMKALDLYKADKGYYPSWTQDNSWHTHASTICPGHTNGYSYSTATDNTWMKPLIDGGYLKSAPVAPNNSCTSYYRYISTGDPTAYNCPSRTMKYYVIEVSGVEGTPAPADASDLTNDSNPWRPCTGATAGWGNGSDRWVFTKDDV
jgi:prepilin-type N-terminal cleavage/methylation domain-containing protein